MKSACDCLELADYDIFDPIIIDCLNDFEFDDRMDFYEEIFSDDYTDSLMYQIFLMMPEKCLQVLTKY